MFALCEGPHDVAFLYRILQVNGLQKYSKPIGEFPAPLNKYFASEAAGENLEQLKLEEVRNRRLPSEVLAHKDDALVLLYAIGGDSQVEPRQKLLQDVARIYGRHQPEEKKIKTTGDIYYFCGRLVPKRLFPSRGIKREPGEIPGQTRCCEAPPIIRAICTTGRFVPGRSLDEESVRRPANDLWI